MIDLSKQEILRINGTYTYPLIYYDRKTSERYWKVIIAIENYDVLSIDKIERLEILPPTQTQSRLSTTKFNNVSEKTINESGVYRDMDGNAIDTVTLVFEESVLQDDIKKLQGRIAIIETELETLKNKSLAENSQISLVTEFLSNQMNTIQLNDQDALYFKSLYPTWKKSIGQVVSQGYKFVYKEKLYKVLKESTEIQAKHIPGQKTDNLYEKIDKVVL